MMDNSDIILLLLVIMIVPASYGELNGGSSIVPVPTRPFEYHELRCDPFQEQNISLFTEYQFAEHSTTDSVWNISVGVPLRVKGITWAGEYVPEGILNNMVFTPDMGYDYVIIPIQIQNIGEKEFCFDLSRLNLTNNQTGIEYPIDEDMDFLKHPLSQLNYVPGDGGSGNIAYQVPNDTEDIDLVVRLQDKKIVYLLEA
ncbi:MAG TPA: DUF4352 domain-containing protein [Methanospirillum sp.]|nr:DUF4352 domain-containing protein [Methanospirillum sp.]